LVKIGGDDDVDEDGVGENTKVLPGSMIRGHVCAVRGGNP
jgi:hypothetical protein